MKPQREKSRRSRLSPRTRTLLSELGEECERVLKLLAKLDRPGNTDAQVETVLGELSAAVLHLHEHTRGLDEIVVEDRGEA
jgi:hypothetical protein